MPKTLLYIGRFQPFHNGHKALVDDALSRCDNLVVGFGSANARPSPKNPFSLSEREEMLRSSVQANYARLMVTHLYDFPKEDNYWAKQVRTRMLPYDDWGVYGYSKDTSSFYLQLFPERELLTYSGAVQNIDATTIRQMFFREDVDMNEIAKLVPAGTFEFLTRYKRSARWSAACKGAYL